MKRTRNWLPVLSALLLAVVFSLVFYTCNTPIGPEIGSDNAMYLTMGTALAKGAAPYSDIFDHKGPMLFVLQMIPQLFTDGYSMNAVFVQEVLFLFACLLVIIAIARHVGVCPILAQLVYLALISPLADGGNLGEEYANLFTLLGILLMLRTFDRKKEAAPRALLLPALIMGACAMFCFLTRANNALPLCGAVGTLAVCLLIQKRFAHVGVCAAGFVLGAAAMLLPVVLWLAYHGAIQDAIYGAITHNLMYAETGEVSRVHTLLMTAYGRYAILLAALSCGGALCLFLRRRRLPLALAMVVSAAAAGYAGFISHKFYYHYLMLGVPMAALGTAQIIALAKEKLPAKETLIHRGAAIACCVMLLGVGAFYNGLRLERQAATDAMIPDAQALYALVPEEDRDSFLAYRAEPKWYVATQALPCMRFYFLQEILGQADPAVMDEIAATFETNPPKWVVLFYNRPFSPPYDARVQAVFDTRYEFVDAKGEYQLLRLKEAQ